MTTFQHLQAVVLDWAGTTVDHGSCAPAIVFQVVFHRRGIAVSVEQARAPMGRAKRDHIASIVAMPSVAAAWREKYGSDCGDQDIDAMYADFLPLQEKTLKNHSVVLDGVSELAEWLRERGLKIGSSTGYTRELMEIVQSAAERQGYQPDCILCAEDAPRGRPAPYLLFEAAKRLDVFPLWTMVKVDDTPVGIEAGRNAGCWTIGVTRTGNGVGLTQAEFEALTSTERAAVISRAAQKLVDAGAHAVVESVAEMRPVLEDFDNRLQRGEFPV